MTLDDNVKARHLQTNGLYKTILDPENPRRSQYEAMNIKEWKSERAEAPRFS